MNISRQKFGLALLIAAIAFMIIYSLPRAATAVHGQLDEWKMLPRPERLSELYFDNHKNLPQKFSPDDIYDIRFSVKNLEHRVTTYDFTVSAETPEGSSQALDAGKFTLSHNQNKPFASVVNIPDLGPRVKISVTLNFRSLKLGDDNLSPSRQIIYFWTERR